MDITELKSKVPRYCVAPYLTKEKNISFEEFLSLGISGHLFLDSETRGSDPKKHEIVMLQLLVLGKHGVNIDWRHLTDEQRTIVGNMINQAELVIMANSGFDYNMLKQYGIVITTRTFDVLNASELLELGLYSKKDLELYKSNNNDVGRYSLKDVAKRLTGYEMDKSTALEFLNIRSLPFSDRQWDYGFYDTEIMPLVYKAIRKQAIKQGMTKTFKAGKLIYDDLLFSSAHALCVADISYYGVGLDPVQWLKNRPYYTKLAIDAQDRLIELAIQAGEPPVGGMFGRLVNINWNSAPQVLDFFEQRVGFIPRDKVGKPSASAPVLEKLGSPIALAIIEYRQANKNVTSFGEAFIKKHLKPDGRLYPRYSEMVSTFRMSASQPNTMQFPKIDSFRMSIVPQVGYYCYTADYPQQESHLGGQNSGDISIKEFYETGHGDMHSYLASKILSKVRGVLVAIPPKKEDDETAMKLFKAHPDCKFRDLGKVLGFLIDYGGSARALADKMKITLKAAKSFIKAFFEAFPAKAAYFEKMYAFGLKHGYVYLSEFSSIKRYFPEHKRYVQLKKKKNKGTLTRAESSAFRKIEGIIKRRSINTPNQGGGALMTKAASIIERELLIERGILPLRDAIVKPVLFVHDEKMQEVKLPEAQPHLDILPRCMNEAALVFCPWIPMTVQAKVANYWKH